MGIEALRRTWVEAGALGAGIELAHGAINRCTPLFVLAPFVLRRSTFIPPDGRLDVSFREAVLDEGDLLRYARSGGADLEEAFVRSACGRGDRCHAILHGDALASYAWSSPRPTHIALGLVLRFDERWMYTYKAFTLPRYRGRRLHARVTANVLAEAQDRGVGGVFGCVAVDNAGSAKSFRRMGGTRAGTLTALRVLGRYRTHRTPGSIACGFQLAPCDGCPGSCMPHGWPGPL